MKTKIYFIIFWFLLITSFVFFASFVHFKANGWSLNLKTMKIVKTGMISLSGDVSGAQIKLNRQLQGDSLPLKLGNLSEGYYDVTIEKEEYQPWQRTVKVEAGKAEVIQDILLFLEVPKVASAENITSEAVKKEFENQSKNIRISGSEVFFKDNFVSRFSQNISGAIAYSDNAHLVFQINDEIRVIDADGSNNQLLIKLSSSLPTQFFLRDNDRTLYYLDNGVVLGRTIR